MKTLNLKLNFLPVEGGYSAHFIRATFATTALENEADIEEIHYAVGQTDIPAKTFPPRLAQAGEGRRLFCQLLAGHLTAFLTRHQ